MADCRHIVDRLLSAEAGGDTAGSAEVADEVAAHLETCRACAATAERLAQLDGALGELATEPTPPPSFDAMPRVQRAADAAARQRRQVRTLRRAVPFAVAALAGMAAVTLVLLPRQRTSLALPAIAAPAAPAIAGDGAILDASAAPAHALLANGAQVTVQSGRARVDASTAGRSAVRLESGQVFLEVPHLAASTSLAVLTADGEFRVHGTRFNVVKTEAGSRVTVTEGTVEVRPRDATQATFLLHAGETAFVEDNEHARRRARATATEALEHGRGADAETAIRAWLASDPPPEEAAEAWALRAWKQSADGDHTGAIASYRHALALLPPAATPLWADNAAAQLALLVEHDDPHAGATEWQAYLTRFPQGTHAALARSRLAKPERP